MIFEDIIEHFFSENDLICQVAVGIADVMFSNGAEIHIYTCKAKKKYLLTCTYEVSRYCLLTLHDSIYVYV